jgi:hypothetical protein
VTLKRHKAKMSMQKYTKKMKALLGAALWHEKYVANYKSYYQRKKSKAKKQDADHCPCACPPIPPANI